MGRLHHGCTGEIASIIDASILLVPENIAYTKHCLHGSLIHRTHELSSWWSHVTMLHRKHDASWGMVALLACFAYTNCTLEPLIRLCDNFTRLKDAMVHCRSEPGGGGRFCNISIAVPPCQPRTMLQHHNVPQGQHNNAPMIQCTPLSYNRFHWPMILLLINFIFYDNVMLHYHRFNNTFIMNHWHYQKIKVCLSWSQVEDYDSSLVIVLFGTLGQ